MLIDDLREWDINFAGYKIRDAIVFKINERADDFGLRQVEDEIEPLPTKLPYDNMVIQFEGSLNWYLCKETANGQLEIKASMFSQNSEVTEDNNPLWVIFLSVDGINFTFNGWNIYYPGQRMLEFNKNGERNTKSPMYGENEQLINDHAVNTYKYLQAFLNILSCKNIKTELEKPDEKLQKKRISKGKLPLVSYYTLKIQNISHDSEATSKGLWSNRVHFCRGHMREYTAEAPLFGRFVGRFWIAPHVRGDKGKGVIFKDYEVITKGTK